MNQIDRLKDLLDQRGVKINWHHYPTPEQVYAQIPEDILGGVSYDTFKDHFFSDLDKMAEGGTIPEGKDGDVKRSWRKGKKMAVYMGGKWHHFGDSSMEDFRTHKSEKRKDAWYSRHKSALQGDDPRSKAFRVYAKKTWQEGGDMNEMSVPLPNGQEYVFSQDIVEPETGRPFAEVAEMLLMALQNGEIQEAEYAQMIMQLVEANEMAKQQDAAGQMGQQQQMGQQMMQQPMMEQPISGEASMRKGGYLKDENTYVTKDGRETERGLWANVYLKKKREGMQEGGEMGVELPPNANKMLTYELWESYTGKPWSQAKKMGFTTGSYEDNLKLRERILSGDLSIKPEANLPEVSVTAEAPNWLKYKKEFMQENPFSLSRYVEERVNQPQTGKAAYERIDEQEFRKNVAQQGKKMYENKMYDYIQRRLVETNPQAGRPRGEWLDSFSEKEQGILTRNPRFQPTYITEFKRSLQSAFEQNPNQAFYNIYNSPDFTQKEKKEIIMEHIDNPIVSKLADAAGIFAPLSMGSKVIQSAYRDDTTIASALQGIKNDASMVEDIITDITTFIGPGTAAKFKNLLRVGKVDDAAKVLSQISSKLPEESMMVIKDYAGNPVIPNAQDTNLIQKLWTTSKNQPELVVKLPKKFNSNLEDMGLGVFTLGDANDVPLYNLSKSLVEQVILYGNANDIEKGKLLIKNFIDLSNDNKFRKYGESLLEILDDKYKQLNFDNYDEMIDDEYLSPEEIGAIRGYVEEQAMLRGEADPEAIKAQRDYEEYKAMMREREKARLAKERINQKVEIPQQITPKPTMKVDRPAPQVERITQEVEELPLVDVKMVNKIVDDISKWKSPIVSESEIKISFHPDKYKIIRNYDMGNDLQNIVSGLFDLAADEVSQLTLIDELNSNEVSRIVGNVEAIYETLSDLKGTKAMDKTMNDDVNTVLNDAISKMKNIVDKVYDATNPEMIKKSKPKKNLRLGGYKKSSRVGGGALDPNMVDGGDLVPVSEDATMVKADNPQATDSVETPNAFLDDKEVVIDMPDGRKYVFSQDLKEPETGKSFAEIAMELIQMRDSGAMPQEQFNEYIVALADMNDRVREGGNQMIQ